MRAACLPDPANTMRFELKVMQGGGQILDLALEAPDRLDAAAQAVAQGYRILSIKGRRSWLRWRADARARFPLVLFSQELLALLQAGLALVEALETLAEKEARPELRRILAHIVALLYEGQTLSFALDHSGAAFPVLYIASVRASERSGALAEALERFIDYQTQMDSVRRHIVGASVYPAMLAGVGLLVTLFLMLYVVPRFSTVYADLGGELPWSSRLLLDAGRLLGAHAALLLGGGAAALALLARLAALPAVRARLVRAAWAAPAIGSRLKLFYLARFYRSMGMLLRGGLPVGTALPMVAGVLQASLRGRLAAAAAQIAEGQPISQAMERHGLATPIALRMLRVGERTGRMGDMMERIAAFHEDEMARWVAHFTRLFEPLLMMVIGALIGAIVILMYLPIFDLAGNIQ